MLTSDDLMGIIYTEAFDTWTGEQLMFMDAPGPRCGKGAGMRSRPKLPPPTKPVWMKSWRYWLARVASATVLRSPGIGNWQVCQLGRLRSC